MLRNDRWTRSSDSTALKLSKPTNGRSTIAPGAAKKKSWNDIHSA